MARLLFSGVAYGAAHYRILREGRPLRLVVPRLRRVQEGVYKQAAEHVFFWDFGITAPLSTMNSSHAPTGITGRTIHSIYDTTLTVTLHVFKPQPLPLPPHLLPAFHKILTLPPCGVGLCPVLHFSRLMSLHPGHVHACRHSQHIPSLVDMGRLAINKLNAPQCRGGRCATSRTLVGSCESRSLLLACRRRRPRLSRLPPCPGRGWKGCVSRTSSGGCGLDGRAV